MRRFAIVTVTLVVVLASIPSVAASSEIGVGANTADVWFVAGDAGPGGDGSKASPFDSLAAAEAASGEGDTIIVVYSEVPLDGGIQLKDGQELVGKRSVGGAQPVITNSSTAAHDGTTVALANNNTVKHVHIADSYGHGILAQGVTGSDIKNVRITNHNTGHRPPTLSFFAFPGGREGIHIESIGGTGSHTIINTSITDSGSTAIGIVGASGASLQVDVIATSIENITGFTGTSNHPGLIATAIGAGTTVDVDLLGVHVDNVGSESSGVDLFAALGGTLRTNVSGYHYDFSRGIYNLTPEGSPRYGIESITFPDSINEVRMEESRITGAGVFGYVAFDPCSLLDPFTPCDDPHPGSVVDLGGGSLGSQGHNSIAGNGRQDFVAGGLWEGLELGALNSVVSAEQNWWGVNDPAEVAAKMFPGGLGWGGAIDFTPFLDEDPFPGDAD